MVICGIDNMTAIEAQLKDARIGVLTAPTGVNRSFRPTYEILAEKFNVTALFAPEHGIRGDAQAGDHVSTYVDEETGLTVFSIYGENKAPTKEMLDTVDVIVFDMQDVGARYYTFLYAMSRSMVECAKYGKKFVVLDRPNPINGVDLEGICLDEEFRSGVGEYAVPVRYGLTIGEFALYINEKKNINVDLTVVPCIGWKRDMYFDELNLPWIVPSPNIPTVESCFNYIATCYFEGTNISEGRGTTIPFDLVGAPFINAKALEEQMNAYKLDGVTFRRSYFTPTFSKHAKTRCEGVQLHITDRKAYKPFKAGILLLDAIRKSTPEFEFLNTGMFEVHLFGNKSILENDFSPEKCFEDAEKDCAAFKKDSEKFYLY